MTRKELIERVRAGLGDEELADRQVAAVIDRVFEEIAASLREEGRYTHPGFGTFTVRVQAAKTGRNPRTGEAMTLDEARTVAFKPAPDLKGSLPRE